MSVCNVSGVNVGSHYEQSDAALEKVIFSDNVRNVGSFAFQGCGGLREVVFNEGLESIGICAFGACTSLEKIVLPASLKELGNGAFRDCLNLREVVFADGGVHNLRVGNWVLANCADSAALHESLREEGIKRKGRVLCKIVEAMRKDSHYSKWNQDYENAIECFRGVADWAKADDATLKRLIYDQRNGIANAGSGAMSATAWNRIMGNEELVVECVNICSSIAKCPDTAHYREIEDDLRESFLKLTREDNGNRHPMLYNRIVCGLRPDLVVAIPDGRAVDDVYDWLVRNGFEIDIVEGDENSWFRKAAGIRECMLKYLRAGGCDNEADVNVAWYIASLNRDYRANENNQRRTFFQVLLTEAGFEI